MMHCHIDALPIAHGSLALNSRDNISLSVTRDSDMDTHDDLVSNPSTEFMAPMQVSVARNYALAGHASSTSQRGAKDFHVPPRAVPSVRRSYEQFAASQTTPRTPVPNQQRTTTTRGRDVIKRTANPTSTLGVATSAYSSIAHHDTSRSTSSDVQSAQPPAVTHRPQTSNRNRTDVHRDTSFPSSKKSKSHASNNSSGSDNSRSNVDFSGVRHREAFGDSVYGDDEEYGEDAATDDAQSARGALLHHGNTYSDEDAQLTRFLGNISFQQTLASNVRSTPSTSVDSLARMAQQTRHRATSTTDTDAIPMGGNAVRPMAKRATARKNTRAATTTRNGDLPMEFFMPQNTRSSHAPAHAAHNPGRVPRNDDNLTVHDPYDDHVVMDANDHDQVRGPVGSMDFHRHVSAQLGHGDLRAVMENGGADRLSVINMDAVCNVAPFDDDQIKSLVYKCSNRFIMWTRPPDSLFTENHYLALVTHRVIHDILHHMHRQRGGAPLHVDDGAPADMMPVIGLPADGDHQGDGDAMRALTIVDTAFGVPLSAKCAQFAAMDPMAHDHEKPVDDPMDLPLCQHIMEMLAHGVEHNAHPQVLTFDDFLPSMSQLLAMRQRHAHLAITQTEISRDVNITRDEGSWTMIMHLTMVTKECIETAIDTISVFVRSRLCTQRIATVDAATTLIDIKTFISSIYPENNDKKLRAANYVMLALQKLCQYRFRKGLHVGRPFVFAQDPLPCGRMSHYWSPQIPLEEFVRTVPDQFANPDLWLYLNSYTSVPREVTMLLFFNSHPQFSSVQSRARTYSFLNGIYDLEAQRFFHVASDDYMYELPEELCTYVKFEQAFCTDGFNIRVYVSAGQLRDPTTHRNHTQLPPESPLQNIMSPYTFQDQIEWTLAHTKALYEIEKRWHPVYNPRLASDTAEQEDVSSIDKARVMREVLMLRRQYPDMSTKDYPASPTSPKMMSQIRVEGDGRARRTYDWRSCPVPLLDSITRDINQLPQDAIDFVASTLGRMLYDLGQMEQVYHLPIIVGPAGCGKTTILNLLILLFPWQRTGVIDTGAEETFGLMNFVDPKQIDPVVVDIVVDPDVRNGGGIGLTTLLKMITCEAINANYKHDNAVRIQRWTKPIIYAGNAGLTGDTAGALDRRVVNIELSHKPKRPRAITIAEMQINIPFLLKRINFAYHDFARRCREMNAGDIMQMLPPYFVRTTERGRLGTNVLLDFLSTSGWILLNNQSDPDDPTTLDEMLDERTTRMDAVAQSQSRPNGDKPKISYVAIQRACQAFARTSQRHYANVVDSVLTNAISGITTSAGLRYDYVSNAAGDHFMDYDRSKKNGPYIQNARFAQVALRALHTTSHGTSRYNNAPQFAPPPSTTTTTGARPPSSHV